MMEEEKSERNESGGEGGLVMIERLDMKKESVGVGRRKVRENGILIWEKYISTLKYNLIF